MIRVPFVLMLLGVTWRVTVQASSFEERGEAISGPALGCGHAAHTQRRSCVPAPTLVAERQSQFQARVRKAVPLCARELVACRRPNTHTQGGLFHGPPVP